MKKAGKSKTTIQMEEWISNVEQLTKWIQYGQSWIENEKTMTEAERIEIEKNIWAMEVDRMVYNNWIIKRKNQLGIK